MAKKQFPLRIDPVLFEVIERWAADEFRSINAQIEFLLRESARKAGRLPKKARDPNEENNID
ncbi:MAG: toxin-antitoxin system HicB family antitoxin [Clostridia bacterium]|nr:toxin-antitoxin system HicB family antitoxin [Clostridia bacterium]